MATIKDIARLAGVSHGTVSNVLNSRGNVSVAKIDAVKVAAARLGYQANTQARLLRSGLSKAIALVLPDIAGESYHHLYNGLNRCLLEHGYTLELFSTYDREETEKDRLAMVATRQYAGVVIVSALKDANYYYQKLNIPSDKIIFVYRRPDNAEQFYDVNRKEAIKKVAEWITQKKYKSVAVFMDRYPCTATSFNQQLQKALPDLKLYFILSAAAENHKAAFALSGKAKPEAIICDNYDKVRHVKNAFYLGSNSKLPSIYALTGEELRLEPGLCCYGMNYQALGKKIAQRLMQHPGQLNLPEPAINDSYRQASWPNRLSRQNEITLLTLPSPSTDALEKLLPHFYRLTGIEVKIVRKPFNQLAEAAEESVDSRAYDLLRIDMATCPALADKFLTPLADLSPDVVRLLDKFPVHLSGRYSEVEGIPCAIPFDPSMQMLFYRRDIFADQKIRRLYYEKFRQEMTLPKDFEQYDRLAAFFSGLKRDKLMKAEGACATLGGTETIASEFMLRYYAEGGRLLHGEGAAYLQPDVALSALSAYLASLKERLKLTSNWWQASVDCFERGEVAMLIVYYNLFSEAAHSEIAPLTGYAAVPGGVPLLGGGSIGVSRYSDNKSQAAEFLKWLFSDTITEQLVLLGGSSASVVQYRNPTIRETYPWLKLASTASVAGVRESYRPDGSYYNLPLAEKIIGECVACAIEGTLAVEQTICKINTLLKQ